MSSLACGGLGPRDGVRATLPPPSRPGPSQVALLGTRSFHERRDASLGSVHMGNAGSPLRRVSATTPTRRKGLTLRSENRC